jgi:hypothetical protein
MYVYRTSGFNDKVERYGIQPRIDDLCAELETHRIDEVQARFERVYPYLKRRILNQRLIARIFRVDDQQILCLLDIFKRGDNDYEQFLEEPREYGKTHLEPQLDKLLIRQWLLEQTTTQRQVQQLPELPQELCPWLEPPGWEMETVTEDWVIYESEEWVRRFRVREIQDTWKTYYQIISGIRGEAIESQEFPDLPNVKLCGLNERYVLYSELKTAEPLVGGVLFLLAPFDRQPSRQEIIEVGKKTALFDGSRASNVLAGDEQTQLIGSLQDLTPYARRSYPAYLLADEESWLAIEQGNEANLALSTEEERILKSVSRATPGQGSLPLFINGRAGSGKSTMLLYLFADYCYRKYYDKVGRRRSQPLPGEPLFITYNERLLQVAREGVNTLLASHHRFVAERSQGSEMLSIDRFFEPFQKFLFNLLPAQEREPSSVRSAQSRFDPEKYISFHRFKQLYQGKSSSESLAKVALHLPEARHYSPEICWHVIRSFIKGYSLEESITPEDYQKDVPRKERTISVEKFQGIYYTIWERWYKRITQEQGYWDDQDLIARVLKLKCYRPEYTAIFCDEAQDFTRLELQLIMRLSMFSQYHLGYQPIHSLPFAFAGDPFQTLNPTGFHWSSVQAAFDSEVITALDPTEQLKLVINFQELAYNYRSTPPIVQFTNLIQLWRHVLFNIQELKPQTAWQQGNFPEPQKFILNQNINPQEIGAYIKDTIIIVPCEEGEEATYAMADEVLSKIFPQLESSGDGETTNNQQPIKNVLSAISAKGLEFKKVILYKFGEDCSRSVWNVRGQGADQKVKVEYFFNKLYVAASRATERLFVVDSEKGDRQLWEYASDEALLQAMLQFAKNKGRWEESVRTITPGTPKTVRELREDDPGAIAHEFETKGLDSRNASLLRRARQFYSDIGNTAKADFCEAWALKFEEQFMLAGCRFLQVGESERAWECFWQGMCWPELVSWYNLHPERDTVERAIAIFMVAEPQNVEALKNFTSVVGNQVPVVSSNVDIQLTSDNGQLVNSKQWKKAVEEYISRINALPNADLKPDEWQQFGEVLVALESVGYSKVQQLVGECFYRAKNYEQAIRSWDAGGATQKPEYNRAKAMVRGYPEGLEYLAQAGEHDTIITQWEQVGKPRDRRWIAYVAPALEAKQQYQQACIVYVWLDELPKVKECFDLANQGSPQFKLLTILLQYFYRKKYFADAIEALEIYLPTISGFERQKLALRYDAAYELACSPLKPEDITKEQRKRYEKFIKEQVLSTSDWQKYLLMQQVGVALEKTASLVDTLDFYEKFIVHPERELNHFAKERWIATKRRQIEYFRNQNQTDKAAKSQADLVNKARHWSISPHSVPLTPPQVARERPSTEIQSEQVTQIESSKPPTVSQWAINGLQSETKLEQLEGGVVRFGIRHLTIKVMRQTKQVLITDALNSREVRVDGEQYKVNIGEATIEAVGSSQLLFSLSTSGYSGNLIRDGKMHRLELKIQGYASKISIEL